MISSPNGAALIFTVASPNLFRSAPLGLFVLETLKPRALPWADLWLACWAGTQTELHSNAAYRAASNLSDTHCEWFNHDCNSSSDPKHPCTSKSGSSQESQSGDWRPPLAENPASRETSVSGYCSRNRSLCHKTYQGVLTTRYQGLEQVLNEERSFWVAGVGERQLETPGLPSLRSVQPRPPLGHPSDETPIFKVDLV